MHGGIYKIDEFNLADANLVGGFINPLGDGSTRTFEVPGLGSVPINPRFVICATQNDGYAGTEEQNEATMSRFKAFVLAQPESIADLLHAAVAGELAKKKRLGLMNESVAMPDEKYFKAAVAFYDACKYMVLGEGNNKFANNNGGIGVTTDTCLNIRGIVSAIAILANCKGCTTLSEELEDSVINICPEEERAVLLNMLNRAVTC